MTSSAANTGLSFAHVSDPHLSDLSGVQFRYLLNKRLLGYLSWHHRRRHEHRTEVLDALQKDLENSGAQQVLVSGDLTHIGLPDEFTQARQWLDSIKCPDIAVVPGNHDSYVNANWSETYQKWLPYMQSETNRDENSLDGFFPALMMRGNVAFIGLSTAVPSMPFFASGKVGSAQLDKLKHLLNRAAEQHYFRVVWLHHPPIPGQEKKRKHLTDAQALMEVVKECGAELILHGHRHRSEAHFVASAGRDIPVLSVPSASAVGEHAEAARYNLLRVTESENDWQLEVASRVFDPPSGHFVAGPHQNIAIQKVS